MSTLHRIAFLLPPLLVLSACTNSGTLTVDVWGEDYIEQGIPAATAGEDGFIDGWSVTFDAFVISVGDVSASAGHVEAAFRHPGFKLVDLVPATDGQGRRFAEAEVPVGLYDHVDYTLAPGADAQNVNAQEADVAALQAAQAAVLVRGRAEREGTIKTFTWAFTQGTHYGHCNSQADVGTAAGRTVLTIHADHLFYDDLVSEEPNLAFQLIADADFDLDGDITQAELSAVDLRTQERYQVGNTGITDLWNFIARQATTLGHIDGEGHCEETTLLE